MKASSHPSGYRISDDERLITLNQSAYDFIEADRKRLYEFEQSKSLKITHKIRFSRRDSYNYDAYGIRTRSEFFDIDRDSSYKVPFVTEGESTPHRFLLDVIKNLVEDCKRVNDEAYKEIASKVKELNDLIESSKKEVDVNKAEADKIYNSIPKWLRWLFKKKV